MSSAPDPATAHPAPVLDPGPELALQRDRFAPLLDVSPTPTVMTDLQGIVVAWNPAAEDLFGYSEQEALGRQVDDLVAAGQELRSEASAYTDQAQAGVRARTKRTRKDGTLVEVELRGAPLVDASGATIGLFAVYHDITELQRQRRYYGSLVDISPTAIVTIDEDANVTAWNRAAEELFGYTQEEVIGRNVDSLVAPGELHDEGSRYTDQAATGSVKAITRRARKDGSLVDVELLAAPVMADGKQIAAFALYHDVSELQRQKQYFESLLELNPVAVAIIDTESTIRLWNPAAEQLFGYKVAEAIGRKIDDLVANHPDLRREGEDYNARIVTAEEAEHVHSITQRTRKDGTLVDVEIFAAPILGGEKVVGAYVLYHDVTELQSARQQAEAANHAKSSFLATMSHEIRTPMNAVIGMAGLLLDTPLSREQRHYAEIIQSSGDSLLTIINDILDFSKIEAGHLELERRPFDLRACIESALDLVAPKASEKSLDLAYVLDPQAPASIFGDVTRLRQILVNLLSNGVKFTEHGEVVLEVDALSSGPGDSASGSLRLHFKVRDTGKGIPSDQIDRLFESFSQLDTSTTRRFGGTGLGLAISRRLTELMDGTVWAESEVGRGSTFHFTIQAEPAPTEEKGYLTERHVDLEGLNVLVVDDNPTNLHILSHQLGAWEMGVRKTTSSSEALELVASDERFDLAILDMQMPGMDGATLAAEIRKHRAEDQLPLMMLTSLGRESALEDHDFAAYLTKPLKPSQLYDALMEVFGSDKAAETNREPASDAQQAEPFPLRLLLAEDNEVNQEIARLHLVKLGYRADAVGSGLEVLEALRRQTYDVVLMDVQMPELDGLEATRRIRREWPQGGPRIIAMTANAMEGDREACLAAGMDDYLGKPIRLEELAAALRRSSPVRPTVERDRTGAFDRDALARLADVAGGPEGMAEIIDIFLKDAPRLVASLRSSIASNDSTELRRAAHTLKSNAESFGMKDLAALCRKTEEVAAAGSVDEAAELVARIEPAFEVARGVLEDERDRDRS